MTTDLCILIREAYSNSHKTMCLRATSKLVFSKLQIQLPHLFNVRDASMCFSSHRQSPKGPQWPYHAWRRHDTVGTMRMYLKEMTLRQKNSLSNISSLHKWRQCFMAPLSSPHKIPPKWDKTGPEAKLQGELHCSDELSIHWVFISISWFTKEWRWESSNWWQNRIRKQDTRPGLCGSEAGCPRGRL